jgi:serine/threonine protein kinase
MIRDRYVIEDLLGKGGFGAVYRVRDQRVRGNQFALKEVIDPGVEEQKRFVFEGEMLKRLDHPGLPRVYRIFTGDNNESNRLYLLMDYIDGPNLEQLRQRHPQKRLSLAETMAIMAPIVTAVHYLHEQQPPIIHRDIKPANIIVPDERERSVLVDFGIAKEYEQDGTTTAIRRCSPGYGAPEQYARGTNVQTDVYGLGATFYALLTGTVPTDALYRMTQMGSRRGDPLEPVNELAPDVPEYVATAIHCAMAINVADRFPSVDAFWDALHTPPVIKGTPDANLDLASAEGAFTLATTAKRPRPLAAPITPIVAITPAQPVTPTPSVSVMPAASSPITSATPSISRPGAAFERSQERKRRRPLLLLLAALLALFALTTGVLFESGILPGLHPSSASSPKTPKTHVAPGSGKTPTSHTTPTSSPTAKATSSPTPTSTPAQTPTTIPTTGPTPGPTTGPTPQPTTGPTTTSSTAQLATFYTGTVIDAIGPTTATMQLTTVSQTGTSIQGNFVVYSPLQGSNPFTGTISSNSVQFTVSSYGGHFPLFFTGTVQPNGSISGTYCSLQGNTCNDSQGHGTWQVAP